MLHVERYIFYEEKLLLTPVTNLTCTRLGTIDYFQVFQSLFFTVFEDKNDNCLNSIFHYSSVVCFLSFAMSLLCHTILMSC